LVQFLQLLVKVLVEFDALDKGGVRFRELVAIVAHKDGPNFVDELIDPW
jgi:hypothetical protein